MDETASYIIWVLILLIIFILIRVICTAMCRRIKEQPESTTAIRRRVVQRITIDPVTRTATTATVSTDRQGNIFTISDDTTMNNRYADFFYLEPNSEEAARIRSQLDKDDKDLPTYDEVMHLSNIAAATQTSPCGAPNIGVSTTSIATTDTILTVPPYSEIDPNAITIAPVTSSSTITPNTHAAITNDTGIGTPLVAPSTSRAAATNIANTTTLTVTNSASNTSV